MPTVFQVTELELHHWSRKTDGEKLQLLRDLVLDLIFSQDELIDDVRANRRVCDARDLRLTENEAISSSVTKNR